jgi:hypothetical protein
MTTCSQSAAILAHVIERARAALAAARERTGWPDLAYLPATNDTDVNVGRRALVLWGMQYDWRAADLPLHRFLAEQEALYRANVAGAGSSDELELAGYLLARHRQVEDVWRHWDLKMANFDTSFAYDVEALVVAGVAVTLAYVRSATHPERDDVLTRLTREPVVTDESVERYFARKARWFPPDPDGGHPDTWRHRAEDLAHWEL